MSTDTSTDAVGDAPPTRRGASLVAAGIFLRVSGLVREVFVRGLLGLSVAGDASPPRRCASRTSSRTCLANDVLSATFIPVYSKLVDEDREEAGRLAGAVATLSSSPPPRSPSPASCWPAPSPPWSRSACPRRPSS